MTRATLSEIAPGHFSERDLHWLNVLRESWNRGLDFQLLAYKVGNRILLPYRINGDGVEGIWITQLNYYEHGFEFDVWGVSGKLTSAAFNDLLKQHMELAKSFKARWVSAKTEDPRIQHILEKRFGFKPCAVSMSYELRGGLH